MSRNNDPPFDRGTTHYGTDRTIDTNNLEGAELEGVVRLFEDLNYSAAGAKTRRTNRRVLCMLIRNFCGINILPGQVVTCSTANPPRVNGNADSAAEDRCVFVDEWLPSSGVRHGDLFWAVLRGPVLSRTPPVAGVANIAAGAKIVAATGASASTAATATTNDNGSVAPQVLAAPTDAGSTTTFSNQVQNKLGYAMSARTTSETNAAILIDANISWLPPEA